jgi:hypothetical protein
VSALPAAGTAVAAALMFGISSVADQRSTKRVAKRKALSPRILVDLVRQPLWLTAVAANVAAFALQIVALSLGSIALVEPILVCDLVFAVLISGYLRRRAGLETSPLIFLGAARDRKRRPLALALACGVNYGVAAFAVKLMTYEFSGGLPEVLSHWPFYVLAVAGPAGFILSQDAFQQGTLLAPVQSIITTADPVISIALGVGWLSVRLRGGAAAITGEVLFLLLMTAGVVITAGYSPMRAGRPALATATSSSSSSPSPPGTAD